jgi:hypothetical protein
MPRGLKWPSIAKLRLVRNLALIALPVVGLPPLSWPAFVPAIHAARLGHPVIGGDKIFHINALNGRDSVLVDGRVKRGHDARNRPRTNKPTGIAISARNFLDKIRN